MVVALANVACDFHLRGGASATMPESLKQLRVVVSDSKLVNEPLRMMVENTLQADTDVLVTDDPGAAALILSDERSDISVIAVNIAGRASAYTMRYEMTYRVVEAGGRTLVPTQSVRLLRDFTFDPVNVLAKEREEEDLRRVMRREAAQQIARRLSRYVSKDSPTDAARP